MLNVLLVSTTIFAALQLPPVVEEIEPTHVLEFKVGSSKIFRSKKKMIRISIPHPNKLSVNQFSQTQFELIANRQGETVMTIWFEDDGETKSRIIRFLVRIR